MKKKSQVSNVDTDAEGLLEALMGGDAPSLPSTKEQNSNSPSSQLGETETYQLPVQVGQTGQPLSRGDKPWLVGLFSPGVATDHNHPQGHNGVDLKASRGTTVYPIASGVVKDVGNATKSGNYVTCLHENGGVQSFYAHMDSVNVHKDQRVDKNTPLGTVGDTGNAKGRGAHLHYEVKINGSLTNPLGISGKPVGSLARKAQLFVEIEKLANKFELIISVLEKDDDDSNQSNRKEDL